MVSLQQAVVFSPEKKKAGSAGSEVSISKKRKWTTDEESGKGMDFLRQSKMLRAGLRDEDSDIELHLDTPLPLEWQRCLDIKSGQIHFYNTRTQKRTSRDPRQSPEPRPTLDLELNLACEPLRNLASGEVPGGAARCDTASPAPPRSSTGMSRSPSWVSLEADHREMVAAVCMRCHTLVMMCKASPSCPNCKFVHPKEMGSSTATVVKPGFRVLCCED